MEQFGFYVGLIAGKWFGRSGSIKLIWQQICLLVHFYNRARKFFFQPGNYLHQIIYFHFLNFCATLPSWCSAHVSRDGLHLNAVHHRSGSSSIAASSSSPLSASSSSSTSPSSLHHHHRQHHCTLHLYGLGFPWLVIYYHHCRRYHHHQRYHPHQHHCQ